MLVALSLLATACGAPTASDSAPSPRGDPTILLFTGRGTSPGDVAALERVLSDNRLSYATASSRQLNAMSEAQLRSYRLLIVPGGNFEQIGNELTSAAAAAVRNAVRQGLSYLGICAGAFFAGNSPYNGLNLTDGVRSISMRSRRAVSVKPRCRFPLRAHPRSISTGRMGLN